MITTGTDVNPLECLLFMRDVCLLMLGDDPVLFEVKSSKNRNRRVDR